MSVERFKRQDFMSKRRIDVVRASDYDALEAENQRLREALRLILRFSGLEMADGDGARAVACAALAGKP